MDSNNDYTTTATRNFNVKNVQLNFVNFGYTRKWYNTNIPVMTNSISLPRAWKCKVHHPLCDRTQVRNSTISGTAKCATSDHPCTNLKYISRPCPSLQYNGCTFQPCSQSECYCHTTRRSHKPQTVIPSMSSLKLSIASPTFEDMNRAQRCTTLF